MLADMMEDLKECSKLRLLEDRLREKLVLSVTSEAQLGTLKK